MLGHCSSCSFSIIKMKMLKYIFIIIAILSLVKTPILAQTQPAWKEIGQLKTRNTKDIKNSTWSIGGETLDRDYTDYQSYKTYLDALGAKRIRLQGGWSKCEKVKGVYDFAWLDAIIPDAAARGVAPWVQLSYGNPIYEGGGEAKLAGHIPTSPEALQAWDNWVKAMVNRYKNQVPEWEIWNEPDLNPKHTGKQIGEFYVRTARLIKSIQPDAKLIALGIAKVAKLDFTNEFMDYLYQNNALDLVDIFTYHGYSHNPDLSYPHIERLRQVVWSYNPKVVFMQGENGAPSQAKGTTVGAMTDQDWSELTQAKWDLRRMLGDNGRGIATNLFTISDIHYAAGDHMVGINSKGLLKTKPDKTIDRPKLAYKAAQHVFSLFNDQIELKKTKPTTNQATVYAFQYEHKANKGSLLTLWSGEAKPAETYQAKPTTITVEGNFKNPVYVDLITGKIYEIPKNLYKKEGKAMVFEGIPIPDYAVLIADKSVLLIK
jgi:hypothetical protein